MVGWDCHAIVVVINIVVLVTFLLVRYVSLIEVRYGGIAMLLSLLVCGDEWIYFYYWLVRGESIRMDGRMRGWSS